MVSLPDDSTIASSGLPHTWFHCAALVVPELALDQAGFEFRDDAPATTTLAAAAWQ